jgi:CelD/BcsL family acetyltransferase involved in cellulose biosynthesis
MVPAMRSSYRPDVLGTPYDLLRLSEEWNRLAVRAGSPFLTAEWLAAWWSTFGRRTFALVLRDAEGRLRAGGCWQSRRGGRLLAAANVHSGDWDVVAADDAARAALWEEVVHLGTGHVQLVAVRDGTPGAEAARRALAGGGFGLVQLDVTDSPYLQLAKTWEDVLGSVSRNLRSQLGRRRRALERAGRVRLVRSSADDLERHLDAFIRVEGSGWKDRSGTAIRSHWRTEQLYREFALRAAHAGWLRLYLLELDGVPIAGDFNCAFAGGWFLLKTGFDERYAELSPGLVLRGEILRASIEEGCRFYDFLGGPDAYKMRWASGVRPRVTLGAFRRAWAPLLFFDAKPLRAYHSRLQPVLASARTWLRARTTGHGHREPDDG